MKHFTSHRIQIRAAILLFCLCMVSACTDFVGIDPPRTSLPKVNVFSSDATAEAAVVDIYYQLFSADFSNGSVASISFLTSISSDEQQNYYTGSPQVAQEYVQFAADEIQPSNSFVLNFWSGIYAVIYRANAVIEGLELTTSVSQDLKKRLMGEALFVRAFCNFYLVNLWGDAPLVTTTDYKVNSTIARTGKVDVYKQMEDDLRQAKNLLPEDFSASGGERTRANKFAASALLSRVYLYQQKWAEAESEATVVINNPAYSLVTDLLTVMARNNSEAILQWSSTNYPNEIFIFYVFSTPSAGALRESFVNEFEPGDLRRQYWVGSITTDDITYYFSSKYNSFEQAAEFSTIFRLAEQYLIRAEARAQLDNTAGAAEDLNVIRHRASLDDTPANDKASLLDAVIAERRSELFCEWGHRWFDLNRFGIADEILSPIKPQWQSTDVLYPIPSSEMQKNPSLRDAQNPGY